MQYEATQWFQSLKVISSNCERYIVSKYQIYPNIIFQKYRIKKKTVLVESMGTKISCSQGIFEDYFRFPKVEYVSLSEGKYTLCHE